MIKKIIIMACSLSLACTFLAGCTPKPMKRIKDDYAVTDPFEQLKYIEFWRVECERQSSLWKEANHYCCEEYKTKPNCDIITEATSRCDNVKGGEFHNANVAMEKERMRKISDEFSKKAQNYLKRLQGS